MTKLVYICHQFGNQPENVKHVEEIIKELIKEYPDVCFLSPLHATGFLYDEMSYAAGIDWCLTLLDMCDEMWTFGKFSNSKGCITEKEYCARYKIPIIERG